MKRGRATVATHSTREIASLSLPLAPPLHFSSAHRFEDLDTLLAAYRGGKSAWTFYRRFGHPNGKLLEDTMAALEGAEDALGCATGMAAALTVFSAFLSPGDHVVAAQELYGGTYALLDGHFTRMGVDVEFAPLERVEKTLRRGTKLVVIETISNPLIRVADLSGVARIARRAGAKVVVDNTFATPVLCRPLEWGADIVFHSGTKFLNGHGDAVSGIVCASRKLIAPMRKFASGVGTGIAPLDAWLTLRGLKTLGLRIERACRNAEAVVKFLSRHRKIARVNYPKPTKYLKPFRGPMLSFDLKGGLRAARRFVRACRLIELVPSLGDVTTTSAHPARSSHAYLSPAARAAVGIGDGLIRISTGIEEIDDILGDLSQALARS